MPLPRQSAVFALLVGVVPLMSGCYDGSTLVERVQNQALRTRLDEIDLGSFRVTLPRDEQTGEMTEIDITLFGESERYKLNEIRAELEAHSAVIRDETIRTLRETSCEELIEPDLKKLRARLLASMNPIIEGEPLVAIGVSEVRFTRH